MIRSEPRAHMSLTRLRDRRQAGALLWPLIDRAGLVDPLLLGIGAGGQRVAEEAASATGWSAEQLDVVEFSVGDSLHPARSCGVVGAGHRVKLLPGVLTTMNVDPVTIRAAAAAAQEQLPSLAVLPSVSGRQVVLVDDGASSVELLEGAFRLVDGEGARSVALAVACATEERVNELERFAGDVLVAVTPSWTTWYQWHGQLYEQD